MRGLKAKSHCSHGRRLWNRSRGCCSGLPKKGCRVAVLDWNEAGAAATVGSHINGAMAEHAYADP